MSKIHVGVLRGGTSREYEKSLKSGASILKHLPEKYVGHDILIAKNSTWYFEGLPITPEKLFKKVDVVFNALHGVNKGVLHILDSHAFPYTGSGPLASSVSSHKGLSKKILSAQKFKIAHSMEAVDEGDPHKQSLDIFRKISLPVTVSPNSSGEVFLAHNFFELEQALKNIFASSPVAILEEHIAGKAASCIVIDHFRGQKQYTLLPAETATKTSPGNFTQEEKAKLQELARRAHNTLGLGQYSEINFVVHPKRGIYLTSIEASPELGEDSLMSHSLRAVGATMPHFIEHVVGLAKEK